MSIGGHIRTRGSAGVGTTATMDGEHRDDQHRAAGRARRDADRRDVEFLDDVGLCLHAHSMHGDVSAFVSICGQVGIALTIAASLAPLRCRLSAHVKPPPAALGSTSMAADPLVPCLVDLDRAVLGDLPASLRREWLVTNGLGGYASGTSIGIPSRAYHGYLIAALNPPVDRTVLVSGLREWVGGVPLHAFERLDGTLDGGGHSRLSRLRLEG